MKSLKLTPDQAQAAHEGRKTQHREIIETQPNYESGRAILLWFDNVEAKFPYSIGDKVFVQEDYAFDEESAWYRVKSWFYSGDPNKDEIQSDYDSAGIPITWRKASDMQEHESRTKLEITNIQVEKLQDISDDDCHDEATLDWSATVVKNGNKFSNIRRAYKAMWNSIHGNEAWEANPYVFVYEFRRVEE